jgi:hypothetical protein
LASEDDLGPVRDDWGPRGKDRARERRPIRLGLFPIVLVAAVVFSLAFASAPWFAFRALRSAAQNQDIQALGILVDYNAVRGAMRAQIRPTPTAQIPAPNIWQDPLGAMRRALQQPIQQPPQVDEYLTPAAFARMADGLPPRGPAVKEGPYRFPKVIYWDTGRARIAVENPDDPSRRTVFTFQRTALFQWKLVQIRLPQAPEA